jgi:hypothetical protein
MEYNLTIDQKPTYLHVVVTGENTRENVEQYLQEVMNECLARGCYRILIEEHLEGPRLDTLDVFEIVTQHSSRSAGIIRAVAYVDPNMAEELMRFAETVAVNRGLPVAAFSDVAEAEKWLLAGAPSRNPAF